ncbi:Uncharacterised protein [Bordetella pertussis]|nr:Uncharacterised protein [Bordetella pertussis]CPJ97511.1 Uncharacterised protein [Bordetella pertussis]CRE32002.1 Uncharacterised protein [Bordetella pertussis]CRE32649.1 Uncharacterised protein [Bordetella pertussis]CRE33491.1 Uncharacterised protein [Bordetella pertussis]
MDPAGIGGIADRAGDIRAVRQLAYARGHRAGRAARRAARRQGRIARIERAAMQQIGREPAQRERWRIGAPQDDRTGAPQVVHHRTVGLGNHVFLQRDAVAGRKARLVDIDLDRHRHSRQGPGIIAARKRRIDLIGLGQHLVGTPVHHGIQARIDLIQPPQGRLGRGARRHLAGADRLRQIACRHAPELTHRNSSSMRA